MTNRTLRWLLPVILTVSLSAQTDLTGIWSNATPTPLERDAKLGLREFYTAQEVAEIAKKAQEPGAADVLAGTGAHYNFEQFGLDPNQAKLSITARTSIVVEPKNGRIPPMNDPGKRRATARADLRRGKGPFDGPETRPISERCIIWPYAGPPMLPEAYNNNMQIEQGNGFVVIIQEMNHDARVIPTDGSPHTSPKIRAYMGDSRGHWEGRTLVVDTINYNENLNFRGSSGNLHVVERFTRTGEDKILYQFTVEDPATWDVPWSGELTLAKTQGPVFEFACHEGNYGMANTLRGARAEEAKAEASGEKGTK